MFQLTITSSQMQWTSDCTKALASTKERGDKKALKSLKKKQVKTCCCCCCCCITFFFNFCCPFFLLLFFLLLLFFCFFVLFFSFFKIFLKFFFPLFPPFFPPYFCSALFLPLLLLNCFIYFPLSSVSSLSAPLPPLSFSAIHNSLFLLPYSHQFLRVLNFAKSTDPYFTRLYFLDIREKKPQMLKILRKYRLYFRVFCKNKWK